MKLLRGTLAMALLWSVMGAPALAQGHDKGADSGGGNIIEPVQPRTQAPRPNPNTNPPRPRRPQAPNLDLGDLKAKADAGDVEAMFRLAVAYDEGQGVEADDRQAIQWYAKAAAKGHRGAAFNLAIMYDEGEGTPEDNAQAVRYYVMAAEAGEHKAAHNLAIMYKTGEAGLDADPVKAALWAGVAVKIGGNDSATLFRQLIEKLGADERTRVQAQIRAFGPATQL